MRGDPGAGNESGDAEFLSYLLLSIPLTLLIPSVYLRAVTSSLLLLLLLRAKGSGYHFGAFKGSVLSPFVAFIMTLPFLSSARISYSEASLAEIAQMIPWHVSIAIWEECLYRGPILRYSMPRFILSSALFSLMHSQNPGFGILPFIGIFSAGIFLCSLRARWGLIPSVLFHTSWNICLEHLWGFPTSGLKGISFFKSEPVGIDLITGGDFGPEGSLLAVAEFVAASLMLRRGTTDHLRKVL